MLIMGFKVAEDQSSKSCCMAMCLFRFLVFSLYSGDTKFSFKLLSYGISDGFIKLSMFRTFIAVNSVIG